MKATEARGRARSILAESSALAVLTGAGVSAESGVPTFRGAGGLWRGRNAWELATPEAFRRDPAEVWAFYEARFSGLRNVAPNEGHRALAALEATRDRFWLLTQNVDGLHREAGSRNVIELHGTIRVTRCSGCARETATEAALRDWSPGSVPSCEACLAHLRPAVVWFGESLPAAALREAEVALGSCDTILVVGTSGLVQPAASFALQARGRGARVIEVNPQETPISQVADVSLRGPAGVELPALLGDEESAILTPRTADD